MTNQPLSPTTQAIIDASNCAGSRCVQLHIADALRAAADQVVPLTPKPNDTFCIPPVATMVWMRGTDIRKKLLAIAAELEAS